MTASFRRKYPRGPVRSTAGGSQTPVPVAKRQNALNVMVVRVRTMPGMSNRRPDR